MTNQPPLLDPRGAHDVTTQIVKLLKVYEKSYTGRHVDPVSGAVTPDFGSALIGDVSRFAELIINRLNQVPQKNFVAFLDLLGASPQPPQPARVPLTFSLAAGSLVPAVVPAGTQVAATGDGEPAIFETEREFVVVPATLTAAFTRDPTVDRHANLQPLLTGASDQGIAVFGGDTPLEHILSVPLEHILYVGLTSLLGWPGIESVRLTFTVAASQVNAGAASNDPRVKWEYWTGSAWGDAALGPDGDQTNGLQSKGDIQLGALPPVPLSTIDNSESRWLRCKCLLPIASPSPLISKITAKATLHATVAPDAAFTNATRLDMTKDFFPFGETPHFTDTWFLRCDDAFSQPGADIKLHVKFSAISLPTELPEKSHPVLTWEAWNGITWTLLGTSTPTSKRGTNDPASFEDASQALTTPAPDPSDPSGATTIEFSSPAATAAVAINGITGYWIRVRIDSGAYGVDARYADNKFTPADFAAPVIHTVTVEYTKDLPADGAAAPDAILTCNDFAFVTHDLVKDDPFSPFTPSPDHQPSLYLGFELPATLDVFPNRPVSLFVKAAEVRYDALSRGVSTAVPQDTRPARLLWEYWNGKPGAPRRDEDWRTLLVRDDTRDLTQSGVLEFLAPPDLPSRPDFTAGDRYWIRARWKEGTFDRPPRLVRLVVNTTIAAQTTTISNEILGSSDGSNSQRFATTRSPILPGQTLEIREPELPAAVDQDRLEKEEGAGAITVVDVGENARAIWVRWHEVPDFYASDARDRHYVVDRLAGAILFGDGQNGLVPPIGVGNVRLTRYQTGGGRIGNRPAGTIVQLRTTVPYVDKVTNGEAAQGGADGESLDSVSDRVPREIRNGGRAVTVEDYEDLAREASPDVARAKCVPLLNLSADAFAQMPDNPDTLQKPHGPGEVSVVVAPRSTDRQPMPTLELLRRVQDYLDARRILTAHLSVVGPLYLKVTVKADVVPVSLAAAATLVGDVQQRIIAFLHPLTGGFDGNGWDFGREPHESDLYRLIEGVAGVDHVRLLQITTTDDPKTKATGRFLVYAGEPDIAIVFVDESLHAAAHS